VGDVIATDEGLAKFVCSFAQVTGSQAIGDSVGKRRLRLNPKWIEPFVDIDVVAQRIENMGTTVPLGLDGRAQLTQFSQEYKLLKEGKNPDSPFAFEVE